MSQRSHSLSKALLALVLALPMLIAAGGCFYEDHDDRRAEWREHERHEHHDYDDHR